MASPFAEAIMANMIASTSVEKKTEAEAIKSYLSTQQQQLIEAKAATLDLLHKQLNKAIEDGAHAAIISGYEKLILLTTV